MYYDKETLREKKNVKLCFNNTRCKTLNSAWERDSQKIIVKKNSSDYTTIFLDYKVRSKNI